ncbi:hypothetical protein NHF48_022255 [Sphingomonas sp. H160509]|uniref:hypothetical protein n=1 Tax=Sphingomonas sp. H160509 TaxID=2955313 RepID=UPI00209857A2|nr:hypothetical protein [Sphingomonas sp. H160509]MDD1453024.1 hypothetical protein [Sphingomonas sp. H160509]
MAGSSAADANATGVTGFTTLTNSGTIRVDGTAVQGSYYYSAMQIINSGVIESRKASAVTLGYGSVLTNEASGTIQGMTAVDLTSGGTIINRGTIVGNVGTLPYAYGSAVYVADGGTVAGNVTFGTYSDLFLQTGTATGGKRDDRRR